MAIVGGLVALAVVIGVVAVSLGGKKVVDTVNEAAKNIEQAQQSAQATCATFSYPDKQDLDHCAAIGGAVNNFGQTVNATNLRRVSGLLQPEICADVTYLNRSGETKDYNQFHWKLQAPSGKVQSFELTGAKLGSGQLVSGGTTSGTVCFDDDGERGQFVLIWKPESFRADRGIWITTL